MPGWIEIFAIYIFLYHIHNGLHIVEKNEKIIPLTHPELDESNSNAEADRRW